MKMWIAVLGPAFAEVGLRVGDTIRSRYRADGVLGVEAGNQQTTEQVQRHFARTGEAK